MSMKDILTKLNQLNEGSMKSAAKKPTGPKFVGKMKGTDPASARYSKYVGGCEESIIKDLEKALNESPARDLREEYKRYSADWCHVCGQSPCNCTTVNESADEFVLYVNGKPAAKYHKLGQAEQDIMMLKQRVPNAKLEIKQEVCKLVPVGITESFINDLLSETFNSKQEVIAHFVKQGKPAAAGAAAWERGWRGPKQQAKPTKAPQAGQKFWWQDKEELEEYGGVGGYGAASQAPAGTTAQEPDPAQQQMKQDQQQIQKSTNALAGTLNQQGAAQPVNKVKFSDVLTKLDAKPNTQLSAQELQQLGPMAVAASKALQNPQTASQMKQLISKSDTLDKAKELKVKQAQQQVGTNTPTNQQQQNTTTPSAGQTK